MAYTPTVWKDGQAPALNAENLNKIEQGIAGAYSGIEAMTDPMGPWTYCGKITNVGVGNKLSYNIESFNLPITQVINEICLKINNMVWDLTGTSTGNSFFRLVVSCTYTDGETLKSPGKEARLNIFGYGSGSSIYTKTVNPVKNTKLFYRKGMLDGRSDNDGTLRESAYYIHEHNSSTVTGEGLVVFVDKPFKTADFYIENNPGVVTDLDVDVFFR